MQVAGLNNDRRILVPRIIKSLCRLDLLEMLSSGILSPERSQARERNVTQFESAVLPPCLLPK